MVQQDKLCASVSGEMTEGGAALVGGMSFKSSLNLDDLAPFYQSPRMSMAHTDSSCPPQYGTSLDAHTPQAPDYSPMPTHRRQLADSLFLSKGMVKRCKN